VPPVIWADDAKNEVADLWFNNPALQTAITDASQRMEQAIATDR